MILKGAVRSLGVRSESKITAAQTTGKTIWAHPTVRGMIVHDPGVGHGRYVFTHATRLYICRLSDRVWRGVIGQCTVNPAERRAQPLSRDLAQWLIRDRGGRGQGPANSDTGRRPYR